MGLFDFLKRKNNKNVSTTELDNLELTKSEKNSTVNTPPNELQQVCNIFKTNLAANYVMAELKKMGFSDWENTEIGAFVKNNQSGSVIALRLNYNKEFNNVVYSDSNGRQLTIIEMQEGGHGKFIELSIDELNLKVYPEVKIGNQIWMSKNLNENCFRNGDPIQEAKTKEEWDKAGDECRPVWCYLDNNPINGEKYGKLYNWFAVNDKRELAPQGWYVPTDAEWRTLEDYMHDKFSPGLLLKAKNGWYNYGNGVDKYGFAALPSGIRSQYTGFIGGNHYGCWWSSTKSGNYRAWRREIKFSDNKLLREKGDCRDGYSVRCIRN